MEIFTSEFGDVPQNRPSAKIRRMTRRQIKKRLRKDMENAWATAPMVMAVTKVGLSNPGELATRAGIEPATCGFGDRRSAC